jgi:hypothetical protein
MLVRKSNGKLEVINKYDFIDDNKYYEEILKINKRFKHISNENIKSEKVQNKLLAKL